MICILRYCIWVYFTRLHNGQLKRCSPFDNWMPVISAKSVLSVHIQQGYRLSIHGLWCGDYKNREKKIILHQSLLWRIIEQQFIANAQRCDRFHLVCFEVPLFFFEIWVEILIISVAWVLFYCRSKLNSGLILWKFSSLSFFKRKMYFNRWFNAFNNISLECIIFFKSVRGRGNLFSFHGFRDILNVEIEIFENNRKNKNTLFLMTMDCHCLLISYELQIKDVISFHEKWQKCRAFI